MTALLHHRRYKKTAELVFTFRGVMYRAFLWSTTGGMDSSSAGEWELACVRLWAMHGV